MGQRSRYIDVQLGMESPVRDQTSPEAKEEDVLQLQVQVHEAVDIRHAGAARIGKSSNPQQHAGSKFPRGGSDAGDAGIEADIDDGL